ncbi:kinesin heavy chain [Reticulomyxa filosa]|uniref:Kinesin heavy chain n=1 Tax=Reticulomyxa filosa TaxID=46433 RepID=X6NJE9_RETFI|nr:kinesin heavy chain [Reticulomyxa filosa]|eukprot:ETO25472.1 kinesin heavy chain [Reticulomyxa filosa]
MNTSLSTRIFVYIFTTEKAQKSVNKVTTENLFFLFLTKRLIMDATEATIVSSPLISANEKIEGDQSSNTNTVEVYLRIRPTDSTKQTTLFSISDDLSSIEIKNSGETNLHTTEINKFEIYACICSYCDQFKGAFFIFCIFFLMKEKYFFVCEQTFAKVFECLGPAIVDRVVRGFANLVFAYGVSKSGKTHTIIGEKDDPGLLQRSVETLLAVDDVVNQSSFIQMSCAEIYCENLGDLLATDADEVCHPIFFLTFLLHFCFLIGLKVLWQKQKEAKSLEFEHPIVLTKLKIGSLIEFHNVTIQADKQRAKRQTALNINSDSSHILWFIEFVEKEQSKVIGKLCLCDLAGANCSDVENSMNQTEIQQINFSLQCLKQRITQLTSNDSDAPFRECGLTKVLAEYLTGRAFVAMITTTHFIQFCSTQYKKMYFLFRSCFDYVQVATSPSVLYQKYKHHKHIKEKMPLHHLIRCNSTSKRLPPTPRPVQ